MIRFVLAAIMVCAAIRAVTTKNVVHAALYPVMVLAGVAAQYILLGPAFLATPPVPVDLGAIVVLFLLANMLTRARPGVSQGPAKPAPPSARTPLAK